MTEDRVTPPEPSPDGKLKGPASYFPSIEKTYGRPVQEWLDIVAERLDSQRHMEVVEWLKDSGCPPKAPLSRNFVSVGASRLDP